MDEDICIPMMRGIIGMIVSKQMPMIVMIMDYQDAGL